MKAYIFSPLLKCFFFLFFIASVNKGQSAPIDCEILKRELLDSTKCYLLDCGSEIYVWMGRETTLEERKRGGSAAEVTLSCFFNLDLVAMIMLHFL
jgi:gelsolin